MIAPRRIGFLISCALWGAFAVSRAHAGDDVRFSATLSPEQRTASGLTVLTADNVAVIDGLVRQDEAASKLKNNGVDHTRFSQRRTGREREIAGLDQLNPTQVNTLDTLVANRIAGTDSELVANVSTESHRATGVTAVKLKRPLEIHGEISYTYGRSSAGSFQGGDLVLTYDDPEHRYSVLVGYSEYHGKGLPGCFYPWPGPDRAIYRDVAVPR